VRNSLIAALVSAVLLSAGCKQPKRKVIGMVPKGTSHMFWVTVQAGALAAAKQFDVELIWNGPAQEAEVDRQIQIVDSMVARHVDALAVAVSDRNALVLSIDRAAAENLPVAIFDSGVETSNYLTYVGTDNYRAGRLAGQTLATLLGGRGSVGVMRNAPNSASTTDRERGFSEALKDFPGIRIVASDFGMADRDKANAAADRMLSTNPGLNGIFASNELSSTGAARAIQGHGLAGKIRFVAFDASDALLDDLRNGVVDALVVQDPFKMGHDTVKVLVDRLQGVTPPKRIDLDAWLVRKEDLDKPALKQLLHPEVSKYL